MRVVAAATALRRCAELGQVVLHRGPVGARLELHREAPAAERRVGVEQPVRLHVGDPPVALQRAHDADHAEAHLARALELHRERRARPQPERVGQPEPDLRLARPAHAPPLGERRRLEGRVVAGEGDQPQRLAEPEGVRHLDLVARGDVRHARDRRDVGLEDRVEPHRQLVALADRPRVVAQPLEQRGEREHQRQHADADGEHRDRRRVARPRGRGEPRPEHEQRRGHARAHPARRVAAAQHLPPAAAAPPATPATSPRRRPARRSPSHASASTGTSAQPGRLLVELREQVGRRARHGERADEQPERRRRRGHPQRLRAPAAPPAAPGVNPSARCTPNAGSRRATSACAPAASIVPAATSATSENATSSEITIPAAWPSSTWIPARVTNVRLPTPNEVARACASVMSARSGSASHSCATFAGQSSSNGSA